MVFIWISFLISPPDGLDSAQILSKFWLQFLRLMATPWFGRTKQRYILVAALDPLTHRDVNTPITTAHPRHPSVCSSQHLFLPCFPHLPRPRLLRSSFSVQLSSRTTGTKTSIKHEIICHRRRRATPRVSRRMLQDRI